MHVPYLLHHTNINFCYSWKTTTHQVVHPRNAPRGRALREYAAGGGAARGSRASQDSLRTSHARMLTRTLMDCFTVDGEDAPGHREDSMHGRCWIEIHSLDGWEALWRMWLSRTVSERCARMQTHSDKLLFIAGRFNTATTSRSLICSQGRYSMDNCSNSVLFPFNKLAVQTSHFLFLGKHF